MDKIHKILVIEDNRPLAKAMVKKLTDEGYDVEIAYDGKEALEKLTNDGIDLFLLDLIMPEMDGFTFLKELKGKDIKAGVIVVSNMDSADNVEKLKDYDIYDYLIKADYKLEEIVKKVDSYFENK